MNQVLEKYRSVQTVSNEPKLREMMSEIANWPTDKQKELFIQDRLAGGLFLYENPMLHPGVVLEYVSGHLSDDSVSTLYKPHQIFASRGELIKVRRELIQEIHRKQMIIGDSMLALKDPQRKRAVLVNEMTTAALYDLLQTIEQNGVVARAVH